MAVLAVLFVVINGAFGQTFLLKNRVSQPVVCCKKWGFLYLVFAVINRVFCCGVCGRK